MAKNNLSDDRGRNVTKASPIILFMNTKCLSFSKIILNIL